ncbi:hypothetical protein [Rickettsia massiliae]|uniref:hypothetical protein n=1 Tax=Rickettsia massiliae TaxID=35791 RepID=UPI0002FAE4B8|nr:hypothetical protein [Rickettsia massiliae]
MNFRIKSININLQNRFICNSSILRKLISIFDFLKRSEKEIKLNDKLIAKELSEAAS